MFIVTFLVVLLGHLYGIALTCMFIVTDLVVLLARLYWLAPALLAVSAVCCSPAVMYPGSRSELLAHESTVLVTPHVLM